MEEEIWALLDESYGRFISNYGNIAWTDDNTKRRFTKTKSSDGYESVCLNYKIYSVHRLVGKYFVSGYSEERCDINHIDGNKINNYYKNLEWVTHQENMIHSRENEFKLTYDGKGGSQLNEEAVIKIKTMLAEGYTHTEIAKQFGVTRPCITQIASGNRWAEIEIDTSKLEMNVAKRKLNPESEDFKRGDYILFYGKSKNKEFKGWIKSFSTNLTSCVLINKEGMTRSCTLKYCIKIDEE